MHLASIAPAPVVRPLAVDPGQPTLPGLEPDVIARISFHDTRLESTLRLVRDKPIDAPRFATFESALAAANELLVAERRDARWGMFNRNPGRVNAIALMQAKDGIQLVRTDRPVDRFKEPVPGQMFPGQNWWGSTIHAAQRDYPAVLAVTGAELILDLRTGAVATAAPYAIG